MAKAKIDKELIINTSIQIADEKGLNQVTLKELAQRLNIKTPSLYNHVDSLQSLNSMISTYGLKCLRTELAESAVGLSGDEAVHAMGMAYRKFAKNHPGLYEATQQVCIWQDEYAEKLSDDIIALIGKVMSAYPLKEEDMTHIIRVFRCMLHGFASLENNKGFGKPENVDDSFNLAMEILLLGIQAKLKNE